MQRNPVDLALAVGHEVANLLAASRLHAELWSPESTAEEQRKASGAIALLAARAGSLLALLRPLLVPEALATSDVTPEQALAALRSGIDASCAPVLRVDPDAAAGLPAVPIASELLYHLLLCQLYTIVELADREEPVQVSAVREGEEVVFELQRSCVNDPPRTLDDERPAPSGPGLVLACSEAILARSGGTISAAKEGGRFRVRLRLPVGPGGAG